MGPHQLQITFDSDVASVSETVLNNELGCYLKLFSFNNQYYNFQTAMVSRDLIPPPTNWSLFINRLVPHCFSDHQNVGHGLT